LVAILISGEIYNREIKSSNPSFDPSMSSFGVDFAAAVERSIIGNDDPSLLFPDSAERIGRATGLAESPPKFNRLWCGDSVDLLQPE
jgi:hypothetical protein